jgi:hypothetical protein
MAQLSTPFSAQWNRLRASDAPSFHQLDGALAHLEHLQSTDKASIPEVLSKHHSDGRLLPLFQFLNFLVPHPQKAVVEDYARTGPSSDPEPCVHLKPRSRCRWLDFVETYLVIV